MENLVRFDDLLASIVRIDYESRIQPNGKFRTHDIALKKHDTLTVKMYKEQGHDLPHIHIDLKDRKHIAGYKIDPAELLSGEDVSKYKDGIIKWITENRDALLEIWKELQAGKTFEKNVTSSLSSFPQ